MDQEVRERDLVESYVQEHALETALNECVNQIVADRPEDPFLVLSTLLYARATAQRGIFHVQVREILDAIGQPTVLVRLHTGKGVFEGSCSSETRGLPDRPPPNDYDQPVLPMSKQRLGGRGYAQRVDAAELSLLDKLLNLEPTDQQAIDSALLLLEREIGRNICLAASLAACRAGARYAEKPLPEYLASLQEQPGEVNACMPMPVFSVINGARYASSKLFAQEILLLPVGAANFADAHQIGAEFMLSLRAQLDARGVGFCNAGSFGGFAPQLQTIAEVFQLLRAALDETRGKLEAQGVTPVPKIEFGIDFAASEFALPLPAEPEANATEDIAGAEAKAQSCSYNTDKWLPGSSGAIKSSEEMLDIIRSCIKELDLSTVVDPFGKNDLKTFVALMAAEHDPDSAVMPSEDDAAEANATRALGGDPNCRVQIVAKELWELQGIELLAEERACNTVLLHLHQFSTLTQALAAVAEAKRLGLAIMLGAVAGQSDAELLAAFAVGLGIGQVKFGGLLGAECNDRYNQLLLLSGDDAFAPEYVGESYRR